MILDVSLLRDFEIYDGHDEQNMYCPHTPCDEPFALIPERHDLGMFLDAAEQHIREYHTNG